MTGKRRGHTTGDQAAGQLELDWVPEATPATTDFVCWLWAAFPPKDGRLNVPRIAKALEISTTTLRRWIAKDDPKLLPQQVRRLQQRAILRGKGTYLWPDLDPTSRRRSELLYADAVRNDEMIRNEPERIAPTWLKNGTTTEHQVHVVYFERAKVFGVTAATHEKAVARVYRHGVVVDRITVPNKFAAIALKHEILQRVDEYRCIAPKHLVPTGRTETWREAGGPTTVRRPLQVNLVRLAGLEADHTLAARILEAFPMSKVTEHVATTPAEAFTALTTEGDVTVLAAPGWTKRTWGTAKKPWPGGRWAIGGRAARGVGMSLLELVDGVQAAGGIKSPVFVVAAAHASAGRGQLRQLGDGRSLILVQKTPRRTQHEMQELLEMLHRYDLDREDLSGVVRGIERFTKA